MAILVEEGLHPNGTDLVVGEHHFNEVAKLNGAPKPQRLEQVQIYPIGEGYALTGFVLKPGVSEDGEVACLLVANVVKPSQLVQVQQIVPVAIGILGKVTAASLREDYEKAINHQEPV